jgi:hypothetical protein
MNLNVESILLNKVPQLVCSSQGFLACGEVVEQRRPDELGVLRRQAAGSVSAMLLPKIHACRTKKGKGKLTQERILPQGQTRYQTNTLFLSA